jgi:hypothetical protein
MTCLMKAALCQLTALSIILKSACVLSLLAIVVTLFRSILLSALIAEPLATSICVTTVCLVMEQL